MEEARVKRKKTKKNRWHYLDLKDLGNSMKIESSGAVERTIERVTFNVQIFQGHYRVFEYIWNIFMLFCKHKEEIREFPSRLSCFNVLIILFNIYINRNARAC